MSIIQLTLTFDQAEKLKTNLQVENKRLQAQKEAVDTSAFYEYSNDSRNILKGYYTQAIIENKEIIENLTELLSA